MESMHLKKMIVRFRFPRKKNQFPRMKNMRCEDAFRFFSVRQFAQELAGILSDLLYRKTSNFVGMQIVLLCKCVNVKKIGIRISWRGGISW